LKQKRREGRKGKKPQKKRTANLQFLPQRPKTRQSTTNQSKEQAVIQILTRGHKMGGRERGEPRTPSYWKITENITAGRSSYQPRSQSRSKGQMSSPLGRMTGSNRHNAGTSPSFIPRTGRQKRCDGNATTQQPTNSKDKHTPPKERKTEKKANTKGKRSTQNAYKTGLAYRRTTHGQKPRRKPRPQIGGGRSTKSSKEEKRRQRSKKRAWWFL